MKTKQTNQVEKRTKIAHESEISQAIQFIKDQLDAFQKSSDLERRRYLGAIEIEQIRANLGQIENQISDLKEI